MRGGVDNWRERIPVDVKGCTSTSPSRAAVVLMIAERDTGKAVGLDIQWNAVLRCKVSTKVHKIGTF